LDQKIWIVVGIVVIVALGALYWAGSTSANSSWNFGDNNSPVMYFYQDDCSHCQAMEPIMQDLGTQGYRVKLMDAETNTSLWTTYSIQGTPTWVAANGDRLVGVQDEATLEAWLDSHGAKIA
jgi:thioredoxin-like negative regulator of GroEL